MSIPLLFVDYLRPHDVEDVPEGRLNSSPSFPQSSAATRSNNKTLPNALSGGLGVEHNNKNNNKYQITDLKKTLEVKSRVEVTGQGQKDGSRVRLPLNLSTLPVAVSTSATRGTTSGAAVGTTTIASNGARSRMVERRKGGRGQSGGVEGQSGVGETFHSPQSTPDDARKTLIARKGLMVAEKLSSVEDEDELSAGSGNKKSEDEEEDG